MTAPTSLRSCPPRGLSRLGAARRRLARPDCKPCMNPLPVRTHRSQRGVTLVVVLLILLVTMVLGIGAAKISLLGERTARFDRDSQVAWQAADAAMMDAEFDIRGPNTSGSSRVASFTNDNRIGFEVGCGGAGSTQGMCVPNEAGVATWYQIDFNASTGLKAVEFGTFTGRSFDSGSLGIKPAKPPRYIIEAIDDPTPGGNKALGAGGKKTLYRITTMGFGPREEIQAVLQTVFRKE